VSREVITAGFLKVLSRITSLDQMEIFRLETDSLIFAMFQ